MEGPKRLTFTTVGPPVPEPKKVTVPKTFRFDLDLSETTDTTCPEYFYTELVKTILVGNSENNNTSVNPEDPFGDGNDLDNLAAIAKRFEDKYNKPDGKKKKKKKWQDNYYLTSLGEGYDESDTFIDNSEAYDEVLPETMTTKLGGFYINSGRLDLKEFSDDSADDFVTPKSVKKNKKRRISSDEGSGDDQQTAKKKKIKDTLTVDGEVKKKKKKLIVPPGEKGFKKPKIIKDKTKNGKQTVISSLIKSTSPTTNGERLVENGVHNEEGEMTEEMKSNVSMAIESVIAMAGRDDSNSRDAEEPKKEIDPESVPKLPPNLPEGMDTKIEELKELATKSRDGKCKFFTGDVNKLLLEVELLSKQISVGSRSTIFAHLAAHLPCSKDTLLKRAKMLRAKELEDKIKEPLEKLKQAVTRVMPAIKDKYEEECKRAALEKQEEGPKEGESKKDEVGEEEGSEEDDEKTGQSDVAKKRQTGPRKKFPWDNDTRNALCDVVRVKMHTYLMARTKAQSAEEFCKGFLEQEVRPLWPKGWMQTRVLYRESKTAHHTYTNPQKPKKTLVLNKVGTSSPLNTSGASTPGANTSMTEKSGSAKTGGVVMSKVNPSPGNVIKVSNIPTNGKPVMTSAKSAGIATVSRPTMPSPNTPALPAKKAVPTLLDYVQSNPSPNLSFMSSALSNNKGNLLASSMDILSYATSKPSTVSADLQSGSHKTWDHKASDILRSSMVSEQASKISPPSVKRQNSTPISSAQSMNTFLAQYANFATSPIALMQSGNYSAESAMNLSTKADQQLMQKHLESERQKQKLVEQQKIAEKQRQLEQQKIQQQNQHLQQQQQQQAAKHIITISRASLDQTSQPKPPSQSPMSLAMSKSISSNQNQVTGKMTPKQLASQFAGQSLSKYSEAFIRQELSDGSYVRAIPKKAGTSPGNGQGNIQSTSDSLRKISPQAVASQEVHAGNIKSQGLHLQNQDHSLPASKATNGATATSLLQSLFGHSQGQAFPTTQSQRSPSRPSLSPQGPTVPTVPLTVSHSGSPNGQWFGQQPGGGARQPTINYQGMTLTSEQIASLQAQQRLAQTATMFKTAEGPK
ncbi:hypothetical protein DPMN_115672 [Dreissena polymorpha]|uniref:Ubinuclein-1 n=2 Tax=Dreissena polymorpha TaxID=45954 RepID=A0A9D4QTK3_DREPO|nr:hypothetical protein DPMN_115672 [Dreissena polymorpha]